MRCTVQSLRQLWPAAFLLGSVVLAACTDKKTTPPVAETRSALMDSADQIMFGVRFNLTDQGLARAYLVADTAIFLNSNTRVELFNVNTTFYTVTGEKNGVLTSERGTYHTQTGTMVARGNVDIVTVDGRTLKSPEVKYDQRINEISSDSAFVATEPNRRIEGVGFRSDPNLRNVRVLKATSGTSGAITIPNQ
jgi:LPS export ABC transporter protein LptC